MESKNNLDPYAFNSEEVVGDDLNVLEFQIPYEAQKKLAGFTLDLAMETPEA